MATDKFVVGNLVLVDFPGSGNWPCQVSRVISKNWRQVEYFGDGDEIGEAHIQVIRDYDEATKDNLEELIPKKKMEKDAVLRQAVKQINQKLAGKKTRTSGGGITTRSESKKMDDKKETGGKQKSRNTSAKKEVTAAIKETRQKKEFIGTKNDVKKTSEKGELKKKKIAEKKAFIGARNKTKKIPGITKIINAKRENDRKKENTKKLRAGLSEMRGSDGLINADNAECQQSRPNNEVPLVNDNTGTSQDINRHIVLNSDSCGVSVATPMSHSTNVNNNHGVADDVDIIIKCEIDEEANNSGTAATEDLSSPTTAEDDVVPGISATSENSGAFLNDDIPAQETTITGSSTSSENGGASPTEETIAPSNSASSDTDNSSATATEDTVRLNISMEMTPNTFSQISPALLTFVSQPNVTVHINVPQ